MHAARALNAQRKRRQEQRLAHVRRLSAASGSRSPIDSVDLERLEKAVRTSNKRVNPVSSSFLSRRSSMETISRTVSCLNASGVNCGYVGFALAIFGSIPLIVGTFIEIPALWEIGLTITVVGLILGIVFWCQDFLKESKGVGPAVPKPKNIIDKAKIKDLMHKPPLYLNAIENIEKDEVMTVELPIPYVDHQSKSEPILSLQSEPKQFLEDDYNLPQRIPEDDSPKKEFRKSATNSSSTSSNYTNPSPNPKQIVEPEREPYPKNLLVQCYNQLDSDSYPKLVRAQTEPYPSRTQTQSPPQYQPCEAYSKIVIAEVSDHKHKSKSPEPEPDDVTQVVDNKELSRGRDTPAQALPHIDTTVQIISETKPPGGTCVGDPKPAQVPDEKDTSFTAKAEISPVDSNPNPISNANPPPAATSPPKINNLTNATTGTPNEKTESQFSSVPGSVPDQVIQIVEVIPFLTPNKEQQKVGEKANE